MRIDTAVGEDELQRLSAHPVVGLGEFEILLLTDVDIGLDRVKRGDGGQFLLHGGADQVAQLGLGDAGDAIHRRGDPGELEIELGLLQVGGSHGNAGLGFGDACACAQIAANGVIQILFGNRVLFRQRPYPGQIGLGCNGAGLLLGQVAPGLVQGGPGLIDRGLEGAGVNFKENLPLLHLLAFLIVLADQIPGHLRPDDRIDRTVQRSDPLPVDGHIPLRNLDDLHHRDDRRRRLLLLLAGGKGQRHREHQAKDHP